MNDRDRREACFWLMSEGGVIDAVCVDIHGPEGELINHKDHHNFCYVAPAKSYNHGLQVAIAYARGYGVNPNDVFYDPDSTATFSE